MSNEQAKENAMILTPRQEHLQRVRDEMAPGEKPAAIVPHTFAEVVTMCEALARAEIAPNSLRGKVMDMAMVIMTGAEVGLPPMASLRLYTTWDGVPRLMAEGMRAIILQSPAIEYFEMGTCDDSHATWIAKRRGRPEKSVTWTVERAKKAGLWDKKNRDGSPGVWQRYTQDMLNARASMQLARIIAPDVVAGMVALEEARDGDFIDAQSVEAKPVFVAPPVPGTVGVFKAGEGPPPGVPQIFGSGGASATVTTIGHVEAGAKPADAPARRGPGRPPKAQPSQTPGTDPFRAAREAVDAREAAANPTTPSSSAGTSTVAAGPSPASSSTPIAPVLTTDRWGQPIAVDPTSGGGSLSSSTTGTETSERSATASTASTASADDGFGGEDPVDSQPVPPGDPGLALIEELKVFLAGCKSQTEMQNGRPPFAQRSSALFKDGDQRFAAATNGKPAGELASLLGKLWGERKAQLPV